MALEAQKIFDDETSSEQAKLVVSLWASLKLNGNHYANGWWRKPECTVTIVLLKQSTYGVNERKRMHGARSPMRLWFNFHKETNFSWPNKGLSKQSTHFHWIKSHRWEEMLMFCTCCSRFSKLLICTVFIVVFRSGKILRNVARRTYDNSPLAIS